MAEFIGNIEIPEIPADGEFPLVSQYPWGRAQQPRVEIHRMGPEAIKGKSEQRFLIGAGPRRFHVVLDELTPERRQQLADFWLVNKGAYGAFTYHAPTDDGTDVEDVIVRFEEPTLELEYFLSCICRTGLWLAEVVTEGPTYALDATVTRFVSDAMERALAEQVQELFPLVKIQPLREGYPAIYLSDRRVTVGEQLYQPRILDWRISQSVNGEADEARFELGNADRVFTELRNDVDLLWADIEFSLFHVNTLTKVDLWKGIIADWANSAKPVVSVRATDWLSELRLSYPPRKGSRTCWRDYDNPDSGCPWADESGETFTERTFNDGKNTGGVIRTRTYTFTPSTETCDKGFLTPNGCAAHGMEQFFGGLFVQPQTVITKDNAQSGLFKRNRPALTSASMVNDSVYGQVIPEFWGRIVNADKAVGFPIKAILTEGRDELDFYAAVGILSAGPVAEFAEPRATSFFRADGSEALPTTPHTLDGQPHHGWIKDRNVPGKSLYGLRCGSVTGHVGCHGGDPLTGSERIGGVILDTNADGDENNISLGEGGEGVQVYRPSKASGIAFIEIRREDEKGLQPSSLADHQMIGALRQGMGGWRWGESGREWEAGMYNPIWIAVNVILRARNLHQADAETQEALIDVEAAKFAANICDEQAVKLVGGEGMEIQYTFTGLIAEEKPLRDWIREILSSCLGYYTFSFGRIKFGLRENSGAAAAFNDGNVIWGSAEYSKSKPGFNKISATFADEEYNFAGNTIEVYDMDHALELGRGGAPVYWSTRIALTGVSTKSQCARLITTALREELGGVRAETRAYAHHVGLQTTVLALNVDPGMICSLNQADAPNRPANLPNGEEEIAAANHIEFRVQGWDLTPDFKVTLRGKSTHGEMYDLVVGPKPVDVTADPIPGEDLRPTNWRFHAATDGDGKLRLDRFSVGRGGDGVTVGYFELYHVDEATNRYGTIVGDLEIFNADVEAQSGNAGDGVVGSITLGIRAKVGVYTLTANSDGDFEIVDPDDDLIGVAVVGEEFSAQGVTLTITAGGTPFDAGDVFLMEVTSADEFVYSGLAPVEGEWLQADRELMKVKKVIPASIANFGTVQVERGVLGTAAATHRRVNTAITDIDPDFPNRIYVGTGLDLRPGAAIVLNDTVVEPFDQSQVNFYDENTGELITNLPLPRADVADAIYQDVRLWRVKLANENIRFAPRFFRSAQRARFVHPVSLPSAGVVLIRGQLDTSRGLKSPVVSLWPNSQSEMIAMRADFTPWPHRIRTFGGQPHQYRLPDIPAGDSVDFNEGVLAERQPWREAYAERVADESADPLPTPAGVSAVVPTVLVSQGIIRLSGTVDGRAVFVLSVGGANNATYPAWLGFEHEGVTTTAEAAESIAAWLNADDAFASHFKAEASGNDVLIYDRIGIGGTLITETSGDLVATTGGLFSQMGILTGRRYAVAFSGSGYRSELSPLSASTGPTGDASRIEVSGLPISGDGRVTTVELYALPDGAESGSLYAIAGVANGEQAAVDEVAESDLTSGNPYGGAMQPEASGALLITMNRCGAWFDLYIPRDKSRSNIAHGFAVDPVEEGDSITTDVSNDGGVADAVVMLR